MTFTLRPLAVTLVTAGCLLGPAPGAVAVASTTANVLTPADPLASAGIVVSATTGATPLPGVHAESFLLADARSGDVLAAKDPHGRFRPASTLKVLTALTLLPQLKPQTVYTATPADANVEGSKAGVVPGATYTVRNLFEAMFLVSGNDAANSLANVAGGVPLTVARMTETAHALGALDTTVVNPSGLDADGQVTSAYDLALFARAGLARPDFRSYAATVKSEFPGKLPAPGKARETFQIYTQNKLVLNYPGALGVKTGWTTLAKGTFLGAATRGGRTLLVSVLHTDSGGWRDARALLDWGFANGATTAPVGTIEQSRRGNLAAVGLRPHRAGPATGAGAPTTSRASRSSRSSSTSVHAAGAGSTAGGGLPSLAWVLIALLGTVIGLRTRVLVRRHLRRQRRRRSRTTIAVTPAPTTAPSRDPRRPPDPVGAETRTTWPTGTRS